MDLPFDGRQARKPLSYVTPRSYATPPELRDFPAPHSMSYATPYELHHKPRATQHPRAAPQPNNYAIHQSYATPRDLHHTRKSYATPHYKLISFKHMLPGPCPLQCRIPMGRRGWAAGCPRLECSSALPSISRSSRVTSTTLHLRVQQLIRPIERGWRAAHPLRAEGRVGP